MNAAQLVAGLRALAWLVIAVVTCWVISRIQFTIAIFGMAAVVAYLLYPWVNGLYAQSVVLIGRQLSWGASVILIYLTLPVLMGAGLYVSIPAVNAQLEAMSKNLPSEFQNLQVEVSDWQRWFDHVRLPREVKQRVVSVVGDTLNKFEGTVGSSIANIASGLLTAFTWLIYFIIALIISQFMLLKLPDMREQFYDAVPERFRGEVKEVMHEVNFVFGGFIKGTVILSVTAALLVFVLLNGLGLAEWLGVPGFVHYEYCLVLAALTLLCYPIPIVGLVAATVIGTGAAFFQNGTSVTYVVTVAAIIVGSFTAVDRLLGPRVMSKAMGVSPLFVMFAAFAGWELVGFWGMILGVPVAAAIKVLFRYVRSRFLVPQEGDLDVAGMMAGLDAGGDAQGVPRVSHDRPRGLTSVDREGNRTASENRGANVPGSFAAEEGTVVGDPVLTQVGSIERTVEG